MRTLVCFCAVILMVSGAAFARMGGDMESCSMEDMEKCRMEKMDHSKMGPGMKGMNESTETEKYIRLKAELGLTEAQVTQLETIKADHQKAQIKRQSDIKIAEVDIKTLEKKEPVDFNAIREKTKQISALRAESELAIIDTREKAYNTLTTEQKTKLPEVLKAKKQKMKEKKK